MAWRVIFEVVIGKFRVENGKNFGWRMGRFRVQKFFWGKRLKRLGYRKFGVLQKSPNTYTIIHLFTTV